MKKLRTIFNIPNINQIPRKSLDFKVFFDVGHHVFEKNVDTMEVTIRFIMWLQLSH